MIHKDFRKFRIFFLGKAKIEIITGRTKLNKTGGRRWHNEVIPPSVLELIQISVDLPGKFNQCVTVGFNSLFHCFLVLVGGSPLPFIMTENIPP